MGALHQGRRHWNPARESGCDMQRTFLDHLEQVWTEPDEGIWEVRGGNRQFTYSKVMTWVAFDRSIKSAEEFRLDASLMLLPEVGFLPPDDPRVRGTLRAIEQRLLVDGLVMRYDTQAAEDG